MFQFETRGRAPAASTPPALEDREPPAARALLSFAEHCVECAAPACYTTCDLFDPAPNGKCRRFDFGIRPVAAGQRTLAEVHFRKWGKLEAKGSAVPVAHQRLGRLERVLARSDKWVDRAGAALAPLLGDKWRRATETLHERLRLRLAARERAVPDHFLAEIINPGATPVSLQLAIVVDQLALPHPIPLPDQPRPFRQIVVADPGTTTLRVPGAQFAPVVGSGLPFLVQLSIDGDETAHLLFGALDFEWERPAAPAVHGAPSSVNQRPAAKCVVFDLDNTLWDGVLLEGEVRLRPGLAELFRTLDERGILISIASKNAESDALARLERAGLSDYLLHPQIGWDPKSAGLARIAATLDIGIDTFLFVDDNPFERAEIAAALPQVEVLPDSALATLADHPRLQGAVTAESKGRRAMYRDAAAREVAATGFADYHAFLKDCAIEVEIRPDRPGDLERVAELVQRTNQLNFSGRKYDRAAITGLLADPDRPRFVVGVRDKFGSYGTVGFCLARREGATVRVEDFMLSCRVQGKYVEQALFAWLAEHFPGGYPQRIEVNFRPTPRNAAALRVLESLGFEQSGDGFARDIRPGDLDVDFLTVNRPAP